MVGRHASTTPTLCVCVCVAVDGKSTKKAGQAAVLRFLGTWYLHFACAFFVFVRVLLIGGGWDKRRRQKKLRKARVGPVPGW